jgi:hypothetical protein
LTTSWAFLLKDFVGVFAVGDGLGGLVFEVDDAGACVERGFGYRLELRERQPAVYFVGRQRFPCAQHPHDFLFG